VNEVSAKINRIYEIQCELKRLRWSPEYDHDLAKKLRDEMDQLATPNVIKEVQKRRDSIKALLLAQVEKAEGGDS
jgi:hypothetical protein